MAIAHTSQTEFRQHLSSLNVKSGDRLVVHSKLLSFGVIDGGAGAVFRELSSAVGESGTLVFPGYALDNSVNNTYDPEKTQPAGVGALSTYVFSRGHFVRSRCPLHNHIAIGKDASLILLADPHFSLGIGSDFDVLAKEGFKLLLLGCRPSEGATFLHHMEAVEGVPYRHLIPLKRMVKTNGGAEEIVVNYFANRTDEWVENFDDLLAGLSALTTCRTANAPYAKSYIFQLAEIQDYIASEIRKNPYALVRRRR